MFFIVIVPILMLVGGIAAAIAAPGWTLLASVLVYLALNGLGRTLGPSALGILPHCLATIVVAFTSLIVLLVHLFN